MKRNQELLRLLLVSAEGEESGPDLSAFSADELGEHAAYLIENGYANGRVVPGNQGQPKGAVLTDLTEQGHDYLDSQRDYPNQISTHPHVPLDVFISHSSKDKPLALAVVELLRASLNIEPSRIRCTSVEGYKLPIGANSDEQLRLEVHEARAFVGLITPTSLASSYVMFELGARWGADRSIFPLLGASADSGSLRAPLSALNALNCEIDADLHQFVADVGGALQLGVAKVGAYVRALQTVCEQSRSSTISTGPATNSTPASRLTEDYDKDDCTSIVQCWLDELPLGFGQQQLIDLAELEDTLRLPRGLAKECIESAIPASGYSIVRHGTRTILIRRNPSENDIPF